MPDPTAHEVAVRAAEYALRGDSIYRCGVCDGRIYSGNGFDGHRDAAVRAVVAIDTPEVREALSVAMRRAFDGSTTAGLIDAMLDVLTGVSAPARIENP